MRGDGTEHQTAASRASLSVRLARQRPRDAGQSDAHGRRPGTSSRPGNGRYLIRYRVAFAGSSLLRFVGVEYRGDALGVGGERLDAGALDLQ